MADQLYRGENAVEHFLASQQNELTLINERFKHPVELQMSSEDQLAFEYAEVCHVCGDEFGPDKVESHCPKYGLYHGAAHKQCELINRYPSNMTQKDWAAFNGAKSCELCQEPFEGDKTKLFDNAGAYCGAYHKTCKPKRNPHERAELYESQKQNFDAADVCCICYDPFGQDKVRDHCHITGKYRGAIVGPTINVISSCVSTHTQPKSP